MNKKVFYGKGLFLITLKTGTQAWRFRYRYQGREKLISLGTHPPVTLEMAIEQRTKYRDLLAHGVDPSDSRKYISLNYWEIERKIDEKH